MAEVTLHDGRVVASDSADWLWECLARTVLRMPLDHRREWISDFAERNGEELADKLRDLLKKLHAARTGAARKIAVEH
jgi:hypothetical protein